MLRYLLALASLTSSIASANASSFTSVECGDHWFKVHAELDGNLSTGVVTFYGDGVKDQASHLATFVADGDLVITLVDRDEALIIDTSDGVHDLYWGSYRQADRFSQLGLCSVR